MVSAGVKTAVSEWLPGIYVMGIEAVPAVTVTGSPKVMMPSLNCTRPAAAGVTVAVSVSWVPAAAGDAGVTSSVVLTDVFPDPPALVNPVQRRVLLPA